MVTLAQEQPTPRLLHALLDAVRDAEGVLRRAATLGVHPTVAGGGGADGGGANGGANGKGGGQPATWLGVLRELLRHAVESQVLTPLQLAVETDLRFAQHAALTRGTPSGRY